MSTYACEPGCGACCVHLIVEIQHLDIVREPKLLPVVTLMDGNGAITYDSDWDKEYGLACGRTKPCPMLGEDKRCTIYPTRPSVCVAMQPGSEQCTLARESAGLEPLKPMEETDR